MLDGNNVENIIKNTTDDARSILEKLVDKNPLLAVALIVLLASILLFTSLSAIWTYMSYIQTQSINSLTKSIDKGNIESEKDHGLIIKLEENILDSVKKIDKKTDELAEKER